VAAGHEPDAPLQIPGGVSTPRLHDPALHVRPVLNVSIGQFGFVPVHFSGSSQTPFAPRH
jgi:hypothetical protein